VVISNDENCRASVARQFEGCFVPNPSAMRNRTSAIVDCLQPVRGRLIRTNSGSKRCIAAYRPHSVEA
jgi:hypothetical protein